MLEKSDLVLTSQMDSCDKAGLAEPRMLRQTSGRSFSSVGCAPRDCPKTINGRCFNVWKEAPTIRDKLVNSFLAKILKIYRDVRSSIGWGGAAI